MKSADTMLLEGIQRKEHIQKQTTDEDILKEVQVSIEERVTPYHHLTYEEQINKKGQWLKQEVLADFTKVLE